MLIFGQIFVCSRKTMDGGFVKMSSWYDADTERYGSEVVDLASACSKAPVQRPWLPSSGGSEA
jgi:hypothetical protein